MIKRLFDIFIASILLILAAPLMLIIALLLRYQLGSPIFFQQMRPGLMGKPFKLIKFRSMLNDLDRANNLLPDEKRMTKFGAFLRASSLDELPELWNVIKGEMSLVGPRPLLLEYLPLYNEEQYKRHFLKPGITGLAQIKGRNALTWESKFKWDLWYVRNQSLWLDIKILLLTIKKVVYREGITHADHVSAEKFKGSSS